MSFQTIINNATAITVNRRKVTSSTVSRSGILKTAERLPSVYSFTVGMNDGLKYSTNRDLVEELDRLDTTIEEEINIGSTNTGLAYITQYLGNLSASQIGQVTVTSASGNEIVLNTTSVSDHPQEIYSKKVITYN